MRRVLKGKQGLGGLIIIMILLSILFLGAPTLIYADGTGQPGDGLNSPPPSSNGETTSPLESLLLFVTLSMIV